MTTRAQLRSALRSPDAGAGAGAAGLGSGAGAGAGAGAAGAGAGAGDDACASCPPSSAVAPRPSPSSTTSTLPSDTLSPTLTRSSFTRPAADDGISIDALSLSTVTRLCSRPTSSPSDTRTSMTSTSSKSPMSGTRTSIALMSGPSKHGAAEVRQQLRQVGVEPGRRRPVDHPVVVGQRQGNHQPGRELLATPDWPANRATYAEDRDLGRVDDRREVGPPDAAEAGDREGAALHVLGREPSLARLGRERRGFGGDLD